VRLALQVYLREVVADRQLDDPIPEESIMCDLAKARLVCGLIACFAGGACAGQNSESSSASPYDRAPLDELAQSPITSSVPAAGTGTSATSDGARSAAIPARTSDGAPQPTANAGDPAMITYHKDVRAIFEQSCIECHGGPPEDRIAPFSLDSWETASVAVMNWDIVAAVESGAMPPWMPADGCRQLADNRSLPAEARTRISLWKAAGYPQGNPLDYVAPPARRATALGEPTLTLRVAAPYTPTIDDEYTCFGLTDDNSAAYTAPEEGYLIAIQVLPGEPSEVHHVQVHRTDGAPAAGPTNCSGFIAGSAENMFSWRPGSTPLYYPEGSAARISKGNGFTVQIHYNAAFSVNGKQPDQTRVAFWFMPEGKPRSLITRMQVFGPVNIPANDPEVISNGSETVSGPSEIVGITPHAHMLATTMSASANIAGKDECLINIPKWDYHWQGDYLFETPLATDGGARINITCVWNNSQAMQPVVNMQQLQSRNVAFGEGSFEEMCLHYIWLRTAL
jgi:mono/diheme cytochrome c family protein